MEGIRPIWNGTLSFGLVVIPIRLYAATERKDISFHWLHKPCSSPIRYLKWCQVCEKEVAPDEMVKAYEYEKGRYVTFEKDELERLQSHSDHKIEIMDFVSLSQVDPIYFEKSFFMEPREGAEKAYGILLSSMEDMAKVAVAKVSLRTKESLGLVRSFKSRLIALETMFWADEVRQGETLFDPRAQKIDKKEMDLAKTLIEALSTEFDAKRYPNRQKEAMMELAQKKIQGREVVEETLPKAPVIDLMEALKKSVEKAKNQSQAKRKSGKSKKQVKEREALRDASPPPA